MNYMTSLVFVSQVGARCLATGVHGAVHNVDINLKQIVDEEYRKEVREKAGKEVETAEKFCKEVLALLEARE